MKEENLKDSGNSLYKKGDKVKFISDEPIIIASRYAEGDYKIEREEYIGVIRDVHRILMGWYIYTIETIPLSFLCSLINESDIVEKISEEQVQAVTKDL